MYFSLGCFLCWITSSTALSNVLKGTRVPINFYARFFPKTNAEVQVFEPVNNLRTRSVPLVSGKKAIKCLVFFTGGSSFITHDIYSNILTEIASLNMAVYIPPFSFTEYDSLIQQLNTEYEEVIPVAHSSGAKNVVDHFANQKTVQRMILMDPVKTRLFQPQKINMKYIKDVLFLNAEKSYSGHPLPFIPSFLKLTEDSFRFDRKARVSTLTDEQHGHCDILNPIYSNAMYQLKICDGLSDRQGQLLHNYHTWLANQIQEFVYDNHNQTVYAQAKTTVGLYEKHL